MRRTAIQTLSIAAVVILLFSLVAIPLAAQDNPSQTQTPSQSSQSPGVRQDEPTSQSSTQPAEAYPQRAESRTVPWGWLISGLVVGAIIGYALAYRRPTTVSDIRRDRDRAA
jgi:hypothetical protein